MSASQTRFSFRFPLSAFGFPAEGPPPGIYPDVSLEDYLRWPYLSNSILGRGERSPAHLKAAAENPAEPTDAMQLGSMIHAAALEPVAAMGRYVVMPPFEDEIRRPDGTEYAKVKTTRQYKELAAEFREANKGKQIVTQQQYEAIKGVCRVLIEHERARPWFTAPGRVEVSVVWDDPQTRLRCKGRADRLIDHPNKVPDGIALVELKTTADAQWAETQIARLCYHRQLAMYCEGLGLITGHDPGRNGRAALVFVETAAPFGVRAAPLSDDALQWGRERYRRLLREFAECLARGEWPGYDDPDLWHLPAWATADHLHEGPLALVTEGETAVL